MKKSGSDKDSDKNKNMCQLVVHSCAQECQESSLIVKVLGVDVCRLGKEFWKKSKVSCPTIVTSFQRGRKSYASEELDQSSIFLVWPPDE